MGQIQVFSSPNPNPFLSISISIFFVFAPSLSLSHSQFSYIFHTKFFMYLSFYVLRCVVCVCQPNFGQFPPNSSLSILQAIPRACTHSQGHETRRGGNESLHYNVFDVASDHLNNNNNKPIDRSSLQARPDRFNIPLPITTSTPTPH